MTYVSRSALPDPVRQSVFYEGVTTKRLIAWLIDVAIVFCLMIVIGIVTLTLVWWVWPIAWLAVDFIYRASTLAGGSATLGMRIMNIEIRNSDGLPLQPGEAMLHTGGYLLAASFFLPQLASLLLMAFSERGQGLHDLVLGTAAINRPG